MDKIKYKNLTIEFGYSEVFDCISLGVYFGDELVDVIPLPPGCSSLPLEKIIEMSYVKERIESNSYLVKGV